MVFDQEDVMKKLFVLLAVLLFMGHGFAQFDNAINWGGKIDLGNAFSDTDSLFLIPSTVTDSVMSDTLFSNALEMKGDGQEGIYEVVAYLDEASGTSASIGVDVRFGYTFYEMNTKNVKWTTWNNIWSCKKDTLYRVYISPSDSTWFQPANVRQYRLTEADADTVIHNLTDFLR